MNSSGSLRRAFLRAPLRGAVIFVDQGTVLNADILNISVGGLLINNLSRYPMDLEISFMIAVPRIIEFSTLSEKEIYILDPSSFKIDIIRATGMMVRGEDGVDDLDMVFRCAGVEMINLAEESKQIIERYIQTSVRNFSYLLRIFNQEIGHRNDENSINLARKISGHLGYNPHQKIALLRKEVAKDYLGLESL
jgi:hypothetical protein